MTLVNKTFCILGAFFSLFIANLHMLRNTYRIYYGRLISINAKPRSKRSTITMDLTSPSDGEFALGAIGIMLTILFVISIIQLFIGLEKYSKHQMRTYVVVGILFAVWQFISSVADLAMSKDPSFFDRQNSGLLRFMVETFAFHNQVQIGAGAMGLVALPLNLLAYLDLLRSVHRLMIAASFETSVVKAVSSGSSRGKRSGPGGSAATINAFDGTDDMILGIAGILIYLPIFVAGPLLLIGVERNKKSFLTLYLLIVGLFSVWQFASSVYDIVIPSVHTPQPLTSLTGSDESLVESALLGSPAHKIHVMMVVGICGFLLFFVNIGILVDVSNFKNFRMT